MSKLHVYVTPDGRTFEIPADIYAQTKFTKAGLPDRRSKANAVFNAWADSLEARIEGADVSDAVEVDSDASPSVQPSSVAQAYAMRVWNGQSSDVPRAERIERVKRALDGQNLPFEGVELP